MLRDLLQAFTAQTAPPDGAAGGAGAIFGSVIFPMILIFAVMYFLIIRPQSKQQKQHQAFLAQLKKGDEVVLQSGLFGRVHAVSDADVQVEIAPNVKVRVLKSAVSAAAPGRSEPAKDAAKTEEKKS